MGRSGYDISGTRKPPNAEADSTADPGGEDRQTGPDSVANGNQGRNDQRPAGVFADYAIYSAATGRGWLAGRGGHGGSRPAPPPPGPAPATAPTTAPTSAPVTGRGRGMDYGSSGRGPAIDASLVDPRLMQQQQGGSGALAPSQESGGAGAGGSGGEDTADGDGSNRGGRGGEYGKH
ncbi:hypothetical protein DL770_000658 [Monosporascus sp. CRB-9-2]|nr:hypothetical protein DL770_000658 [Monosporascus sp. CRB-9-2]